MLVPIEWLKDYTEVNVTTEEFCEKMIMSGSNVESVKLFGEGIENVVVGKVIKKEKHPDADKLSVCMVDVGEDEPLQIVCGAANVAEGINVPVARDNSRIPGPLHGQTQNEGATRIKKGKIRGVLSFGMICSAQELGFDDKVIPVAHKDGIWILPEGLSPGVDIKEAMELISAAVDFEITPNRSDCLSMIGMARESAATLASKLHYPEIKISAASDKEAKEYIDISINDPALCKRYAAKIVTDIRIQQSPWWLQKRLMYAGMRPINNIVDITNFVMLEYGQPIHAFDIRQIEGKKIVVETASKGEKFFTLDGSERILDETMLMIKDGMKNVAVAGVMGGLDSEIKDDTKTILVESANFDPESIRRTSKKLGLRTEASSRFEKKVDPALCMICAERVCSLIEMLGAGTVVRGEVDVYPAPESPKKIDVRPARINHVLGVEIAAEEMAEMFEALEMKVEREGEILRVMPPSVRRDLDSEVDFTEEAARMYGYDRLPVTIPRGNSEAALSREENLRKLTRDTLCALGANEIQTYSFVSPKSIDHIGIEEHSRERNFVHLKNPLGEENSVMRTILTPGMLEVMGRNWSRKAEALKCFEIGSTFGKDLIHEETLPQEQDALCIGLYGEGYDFFTLKGMVTEMLNVLKIKDPGFEAENGYRVYHPGRCARISYKGEELGIMGEIHPDVAELMGIGQRCHVAEFMFDKVMKNASTEVYYSPLPKYPAVARDIALLIKEDIPAGSVEKVIREAGGSILESVKLFDVYRGKQVDNGMKSAAFALTYRHPEKTLTDEEVTKIHEKVLAALKEKFDAVLRDV